MDPGTHIRNIALISDDNAEYRRFVELQRLASSRLGQGYGQRRYSDKLAVLLEKAVQAWVAPWGGHDNRILAFEQLGHDEKYSGSFREIDFVIDRGDVLYIGELKVSASRKALSKAHKQLSTRIEILRRTGRTVEPVLIYINLLYQHATTPIDTFNPEFGEMVFRRRTVQGQTYNFLQLSPVDIVAWAHEMQIINDPSLLDKALEEAQHNLYLRVERSKLRALGVPLEEWPAELALVDIQRPPIFMKFGESPNFPEKNKLATSLKKAISLHQEQCFNFGRIKWYDNDKCYGTVKIGQKDLAFVHSNNFNRRPDIPIEKNHILFYRRIIRSNSGRIKLAGCTLLTEPKDFRILMNLLAHEAIEECMLAGKPSKMSTYSKYVYRLLEHGTSQLFGDRSENEFVDAVQDYYDRYLIDSSFHRFCWYLQRIAIKQVVCEDREMLEQTLYCHFYSELRPDILFYTWQHGLFRCIAYTDGVDYEIPMEILLEHVDQLDEYELDRIQNYSYANTFLSLSRTQIGINKK